MVVPKDLIFRCNIFRANKKKLKLKLSRADRAKTAHARIKTDLDGKFSHKTKRV